MMKRAIFAATTVAVALAGCGGGSGSGPHITIPPARVFQLAGFQPSAPVSPGRPTTLEFTVQKPDGKPLTTYKTGSGPHTGIHLIIVRDDLAYIIHHHPPVAPSGLLRDPVTFPAPGRYKVLVDVYPNLNGAQPNFQLFQNVTVSGAYNPRTLPPFNPTRVVDGYRFAMQGHPALKAIQAQFVTINVTDPQGRKPTFIPWFGALAHAIFWRQGGLDYFHTHVCGAGATNCASRFGQTKVTGLSTTPGKLTVGVLLPVPGTWELFLQAKVGGRVLTVPYTLQVAP